MQASVRIIDSVVLAVGVGLGARDDAILIDIPPEKENNIMQALARVGTSSSNFKLDNQFGIVDSPFTPTPVSAPNIAALIQALLNSASLDQSTKNAIIAALKG